MIHTVLLIDDDDEVRHGIREILEAWKLHVIEAANGVSGLLLFNARKPALIITDVLMPILDGIETLRKIRAIDPLAKVIVMTGGGGPKYPDPLATAQKFGASAVLEKPFKRQQLLLAVSRLLSLETIERSHPV
jgi:DNA-binding NtrC family response regulator